MLRTLFERTAMLTTAAATEEDSVYSMYYDYSEPVSKIPSHRILAVNRGEKEGFLKVGVDVDEERAVGGLRHMFIKGKSISDMYLEEAIADAYKRLIFPSLGARNPRGADTAGRRTGHQNFWAEFEGAVDAAAD